VRVVFLQSEKSDIEKGSPWGSHISIDFDKERREGLCTRITNGTTFFWCVIYNLALCADAFDIAKHFHPCLTFSSKVRW